MRRSFIIAFAVVLIVGAGAVRLLFWSGSEPAELASNVYLTADFALTNDQGEAVTMSDFDGRPSAWFFGFTHCPDVCPTALAEMTVQLESLGDDADRIDMVFVTVDPERDGQEVMRNYISAFDDRIIGITGALPEIEKLARGFFVFFQKVPLSNGDYTMDHTAGIILRAGNGGFIATLDPHESMEVKLQKLRRVIDA